MVIAEALSSKHFLTNDIRISIWSRPLDVIDDNSVIRPLTGRSLRLSWSSRALKIEGREPSAGDGGMPIRAKRLPVDDPMT